MRTFIADIIPRLKKYSSQLDNLTLLTEQHWVIVDEISNSKTVYIFRKNLELLISQNGKVEKAKWEYLGNNSLLIDKENDTYLFKQGFFDENILALKVDSKDEYTFLINETKFGGELNSVQSIIEFLNKKYLQLESSTLKGNNGNFSLKDQPNSPKDISESRYKIKQRELILKGEQITHDKRIIKAFLNGEKASDGRYKLGFMWYIYVKDGILII